MEYTVEYFIKKFEAIPEDRWAVGAFQHGSACCALGHCGMTSWNFASEEAIMLARLIGKGMLTSISELNDNRQIRGVLGTTPKQRILAALRDKLKEPTNDPSPNEVSP